MTDSKMIERITRIMLIAWTVLVGASLAWNIYYEQRRVMGMARVEAQSNLNKDISLRLWATGHGGVYVPINEQQQPIPWLQHLPGRDAVAEDGSRLTLLNPATMLRQVMERYARDYGPHGRITGLRQLNPANAPDDWEREQLEAFTRGERTEAAWGASCLPQAERASAAARASRVTEVLVMARLT